MEIWKKIKGYNDYFVSDKGRIKSIKSGEERILKPTVDSQGKYLLICLSKKGKVKLHLVHRLVAEAFKKNEKGLPQVNHIDLNKQNNSIDNLEWVSASENSKHAYKNGVIKIPTYKGKFGKEHNKSLAVVMRKPDGTEETYYSLAEFKRKTGGDSTSICWAKNHANLPYTFHRGFLRGWMLLDYFKPYKNKEDECLINTF